MAGINFGGGDIQPIIQKDEIMAAKILVYAGEDGQCTAPTFHQRHTEHHQSGWILGDLVR